MSDKTMSAADIANYFSGIGKTKASLDAGYVTPGHYVNRIDAVKMKLNNDDNPIFVIEQTPLHVISVDLLPDATYQGKSLPGTMNGKPTSSNKQGVACTHLISLTGPGVKMAKSNMKAFAESCLPGFAEASDPEQEAMMAIIVSAEQPLAGMIVEITARSIRTGNNTDFTKITYVGEITIEERLARGLITQEQADALNVALAAAEAAAAIE